jgi:hypothetical protein
VTAGTADWAGRTGDAAVDVTSVGGRRGAAEWELVTRPSKSSRIAVVVALLLVAVFAVIAAVLPRETAGVNFTGADQWGMAGIGLLSASGALCFTRPRLRAGSGGVELRGFVGSPRVIEWDLIHAVDFAARARFARLILPADEAVAVYAVQRGDRERSVEVMRQLRALHARYRTADRSPGPSPGASG